MADSGDSSPQKDIVEVIINRGSNGLGLNIKGGKDQPEFVDDDGIFISAVKNTLVTTSNGAIEKGDKVLEINGTRTDGIDHDRAIDLFKKSGGEVTLKIWRGAEKSLQNHVTRKINKDEELSLLIKKELGMPVTWRQTPEVEQAVFPPRRRHREEDEDDLEARIRQEIEIQQRRAEAARLGEDEESEEEEEDVVPVEIQQNREAIRCRRPDAGEDDEEFSSQEEEPDDEIVNESSEELFRKLSAENRIMNRTIDDENLPPTVSLLRGSNGQKIYLIGTAHFSKESCEDVKNIITEAQPDVVVIELCRGRTDILVNDEESLAKLAGDVSASKILAQVRQKGLISGLMTFLLLHMSAHITKQLGMAPGGEFRTAYKEARRVPGCKIMFGDRAVEVTLQRAFGTLSVWQKIKFAFHVLKDLGPIKPEDIEKLKEKDMLEQALGEMMKEFPQMTKVFLGERDTYLARSMQLAASNEIRTETNISPTVVVGVVGLGHAGGIKDNFNREITLEEMDGLVKVPKPSRVGKVIKICFRLALLAGLSYSVWSLFSLAKPFFGYLLSSSSDSANEL